MVESESFVGPKAKIRIDVDSVFVFEVLNTTAQVNVDSVRGRGVNLHSQYQSCVSWSLWRNVVRNLRSKGLQMQSAWKLRPCPETPQYLLLLHHLLKLSHRGRKSLTT